jgi:protoporphyrin/coproporphyrin ferrochelatase
MAEKAILLTNLGSPDSCEVKDVRTYLDEFLMDERVIDIPYLIRFLLVKGIIVPFRAPQSAKKYKTIWTENGSPLVHITSELTKLVAEQAEMPTYMCMRYANPTPKSALDKALQENPDLKELVMVPLYPHYAMSSYETAVVHVENTHKEGNYPFKLTVVKPYYKQPDYLKNLADSIAPYLQKHYDHILFSYHGVPERHIKKSDITGSHCLKCENCCEVASPAHAQCYRHQVIETTRLVAELLGIPEGKYSFSFQSRLGADKWLQPYTAVQLGEFPQKGIKKLLVVCPAFVSDCLETLEEIAEEGKEIFEEAGGEHFEMIPCLNTRTDWVVTIDKLVKQAK